MLLARETVIVLANIEHSFHLMMIWDVQEHRLLNYEARLWYPQWKKRYVWNTVVLSWVISVIIMSTVKPLI